MATLGFLDYLAPMDLLVFLESKEPSGLPDLMACLVCLVRLVQKESEVLMDVLDLRVTLVARVLRAQMANHVLWTLSTPQVTCW